MLVVGALPSVSALFDSFFHDLYGERSFAGLDNYRLLLADRAFGISAALTAVWALCSTAICLGAAYVVATLLHESRRAFRIVYAALLVPWGIPAFIAVPIWRMLLHGAGGDSIVGRLIGLRINLLVDPGASFLSALFVNAWMNVPAAAFVMYGALRKLPRAAVEAARLDGAGAAAISRCVYLPQVKGTMIALAALEFVKAFKEFNVPFLLTAGGAPMLAGITDRTVVGATTTLELYLYDLFQTSEDYGLAAAYAAALAAATAALVALTMWIRRLLERRAAASASGRGPGRGFGLLGLRPGSDPPRTALAEPAWALARATLGGFSVATSALALYALVWTAFSALSSNYVDSLAPRFLTARNFRDIFVEDGLARPFANTLFVSLAAAALAVAAVLPAALRLRDARPGTKAAAFAALQAVSAAGGMHSLVPLYALARSAGLLDSYLPIVLVYAFHAAPFALFTTTAFLAGLPRGVEEAAELEGAGALARLFRITLPLAAPAVATSAMAAFLAAWNGFLVPLLFLGDDSMYTIGVKLHAYVGSVASGSPRWNRFAAASIVNLAIVGAVMLRARGPLASSEASDQEG